MLNKHNLMALKAGYYEVVYFPNLYVQLVAVGTVKAFAEGLTWKQKWKIHSQQNLLFSVFTTGSNIVALG